jgi:peptidoglycan-associated lipoprotein
MQMKYRLAFCLVGVLALAGCATGTRTETPVEDKTGAGAAGAGTEGLGDRGAPTPGALEGTAADADLLAKRRVHFEFDSAALDEENRRIVEAHARHLNANPNVRVQLEGHTDERGTREYNLALGERRSQAVERLMRVLGVSGNRVTMNSYGEEKPLENGHSEDAWRLNRRVEIVYR